MKLIGLVATVTLMPFTGMAVPSETESARKFVQGFYDWYTPRVLSGKGGAGWDLVHTSKKSAFTPALLNALSEDLKASKKVKDEIVGLDFDPFLSSQDPVSHYSVTKVEKRGQAYLASVNGMTGGKPSAKADVIARVEKVKGTWRFTNFMYPSGENLLGVLAKLKKDRAPHK